MAKIIRTITSVLFGSYPQGPDRIVNPIEWDVLKLEGNKALLCSKNVLETRRFDAKSNAWKSSEIRHWLNNEFMNAAFADDEKVVILNTELPDVGTTDKVFLLSDKEAANCVSCRKSNWLWLRTPCFFHDTKAGFVDYYGTLGNDLVSNEYVGVVPALWVDLDSEIFKS